MRLLIHGEIEGVFCLVGIVETVPGKEEQFSYAADFVEEHPDSDLSVALPVRLEPYPARQTRAFFSNLLPEGEALVAVSRALEMRSTSYLQILNALGSECVGAVKVQSENVDHGEAFGYDSLSREELALGVRGSNSEMALLQIGSRLSLAGAQSKVGLYVERVENSFSYYVPRGGSASTHIVKSNNRQFEALTENGYCCLKLAEVCGLKVPRVFIDILADDAPALVIERFDREIEDTSCGEGVYLAVRRKHQEDFCQALGKLPNQKYETSGQSYAKQVRDILFRRSSDPIGDSSALVKVLIFNVVIGNCDAHLKNYSLLKTNDWAHCSLAPFYDLVSTVVYEGLDRRMAMRIGLANKVDDVVYSDLLLLAQELGHNKALVQAAFEEIAQGVCEYLKDIVGEAEEVFSASSNKLQRLVRFANKQVDRLMLG